MSDESERTDVRSVAAWSEEVLKRFLNFFAAEPGLRDLEDFEREVEGNCKMRERRLRVVGMEGGLPGGALCAIRSPQSVSAMTGL